LVLKWYLLRNAASPIENHLYQTEDLWGWPASESSTAGAKEWLRLVRMLRLSHCEGRISLQTIGALLHRILGEPCMEKLANEYL
jgi:hypothetical protein